MEKLLQQILAKLDNMATKDDIAQLNERIDALEARLGALEARVGALEAKVDALDAKIDKIDAQQQQDIICLLQVMDKKIDKKVDKIEQVIKVLCARSIEHEAEIEALKLKDTA